jgi:hypothetical protein
MAWLTADDLRAFDDGLVDAARYSDTQLTNVITDVEAEIERIIGTAYNARTATNEWHLGNGEEWLRLDNRWPTTITAASIDGTALTAGQLSDLTIDRSAGMVRNPAGWTEDDAILISYTYGKTAPPSDLLRAAKILCRARLGQTRNPIMDRAERYISDGGNTFVLSMPSATRTGVPDVDAVLARYLIPGIA